MGVRKHTEFVQFAVPYRLQLLHSSNAFLFRWLVVGLICAAVCYLPLPFAAGLREFARWTSLVCAVSGFGWFVYYRFRAREVFNAHARAVLALNECFDVLEAASLERGKTFIITAFPSITCRVCGWTSFSKEDVRHKYCAHCHEFHNED